MAKAIVSGVLYFAAVFAAGFALGIFRVLVLEPQLGATVAVLAELPVILAISWFVCGYIVRRVRPDARFSARALMGAVAFSLLIGAEISLGMVGAGRSLDAQLGEMAKPAGIIGLAGQVLFAMFPALRRQITN